MLLRWNRNLKAHAQKLKPACYLPAMKIQNENEARNAGRSVFLVAVTYLAFISLGLPDGLLGIAWPFMSARSGQPLDALGILLISFTAGYLSTSSTSGKVLKSMSLGMLLAVSCLMTALILLTYALTEQWFVIILASFFL